MDERAKRMEARLEIPLLIAALLTIPAIIIEETHGGRTIKDVAVALNWLIWSAFLVEAVLMVIVSPRPAEWLRHHPLELAIIVLTPPFLPATLQGARVFRLLRVLRLFTAGLLTRRILSTEGVRDAAVLAVLTVLGGGAAFAAVEKGQHLSTWDGVWWAVTTVTTVGYGDIVPQTTPGRVIAMSVMLVGIGFLAILTAAAAERFIREQRDIQREQRAIEREQAQIEREQVEMEREQRGVDEILAEIVERLDRIEKARADG